MKDGAKLNLEIGLNHVQNFITIQTKPPVSQREIVFGIAVKECSSRMNFSQQRLFHKDRDQITLQKLCKYKQTVQKEIVRADSQRATTATTTLLKLQFDFNFISSVLNIGMYTFESYIEKI